MSSELRVKKLRGSGGYVMASVTDDQQRKGNLGGPDLFLAPIGRLDIERISKYFCNTCERDYEGNPKIEFENPNEEVAENLILVEKGQYLCSTCGSTIAEYREFKKPDEAQNIGIAKPLDDFGASFERESTLPPQRDPQMESMPRMEQSEMSGFSYTPPAQSQAPSYQESSSQVNSIVGISVFDENAKKIGTAKQIGIDSSQSLVLVVTKNDGSESHIPWNQIKKVGEIILVGGLVQAQPTPVQTTQQSQVPPKQAGQCNNCGFSNKPGSKFCEECGSKL